MEPQTSFSSLPIELKANIYKNLTWKDQKNVRLVNREAFNLINLIKKPLSWTISTESNPDSLNFLKSSYFSEIGTLNVSNCKDPLPIYSTKRMSIPIADELVLMTGNSLENINKLLRYYIVYCSSLNLTDCSLANISPSQLNHGNFNFDNITMFEFEVKTHYPSTLDLPIVSDNPACIKHMQALEKYLQIIHFPNLKDLSMTFNISFPIQTTEAIDANRTMLYQSFIINFGQFMKKHGASIKKFAMESRGVYCFPILHHFKHLVNVEDLFFRLDCAHEEFQPTIRSVLESGLNSFTKLKVFNLTTIGVGNVSWRPSTLDTHTELASILMANNHTTLDSIVKKYIGPSTTIDTSIPSLSWLERHQCSHLKHLEFSTLYAKDIFSNTFNVNSNLKSLSVRILESPEDWRQEFFQWLIKTAPNLQMLKLEYFPTYTPTVHHIRGVITHLTQLVRMQLFLLSMIKDAVAIRNMLLNPEFDEWLNAVGQVKVRAPNGRNIYEIDRNNLQLGENL